MILYSHYTASISVPLIVGIITGKIPQITENCIKRHDIINKADGI